MKAIEFKAQVKDGMIEIPETYRQQIQNQVRVIVLSEEGAIVEESAVAEQESKRPLTASDLLQSGLVGLWADREDIADSLAFARQLRQEAEHR